MGSAPISTLFEDMGKVAREKPIFLPYKRASIMLQHTGYVGLPTLEN